MSAPINAGAVARVLAYHERTKHHPGRYARSSGYLDWANQPDPFRTYDGASRIDLPLTADRIDTSYGDLYASRASAATEKNPAVEPHSLDVESIAAFFELALGLTAWKETGSSRWALRADPSSGNLHPTEGYLVTPTLAGVPAGVHHYLSRDHRLEQRCALDADGSDELRRHLPDGSFLVGVASIHWREAWKYGERAFRYCQHDAGHVLATLRYAAAALGWSAQLVDGFGDAAVATVLGLDREEDFQTIDRRDREHPDALLLVSRSGTGSTVRELETSCAEVADLLAAGSWSGIPNALSPAHVDWKVIDDVAQATHKPPSRERAFEPTSGPPAPPAISDLSAATIIRQRRSAVALDGVTSIARERFFAMLERLVPRSGVAPFDALAWKARIHLGIFVHRVDGLPPGLYLLERSDDVHAAFVEELGEMARWTRPEGCPEHLRLFCIDERDTRKVAAFLSCQQDIAADGAFSLGMIAEFRDQIAQGAFHYRRLFWETGMIGQALYLEAEALGIRGTGIGCYFDDVFHEVVGLEGDRFQSLYHFTVGGPLNDTRLVTHPPYAHLEGR